MEEMLDPRYPTQPSRGRILKGQDEATIRAVLTTTLRGDHPATAEQIAVHYAQLAMVFPQANAKAQTVEDQKRAEAQASMKFKLYCNDLADVPEWALAKACARYRTTPSKDGRQKFFPQPWELLELCRAEMRAVGQRRRAIPKMLAVLDGTEAPADSDERYERSPQAIAAGFKRVHEILDEQRKKAAAEAPREISTNRPETAESLANLRQTMEARLKAAGKQTGEAA